MRPECRLLVIGGLSSACVKWFARSMGRVLGFLLLLQLFCPLLRAQEEHISDQVVVVNSQVAIDVPYDYGDVSGGSAEIIRVILLRDNRQILVAGRKAGTTNVIIYDTSGVRRDEFEVTVIPANLSRLMHNLQELLEDIEGLSFRVINNRIYIQGEVSIDEDLQRVNALAQKERLVESMVTLSPVSQRLLADLIEREIGVPGVQVRLVSDKVFLEGFVHSNMAKMRAEEIAKAYYPETINVLEVRQADRVPGKTDTVVIVVHFIELTKSLTNAWSFDWTPLTTDDGMQFYYKREYSGSSGWSEASGYMTATVNALLPRLNHARTKGYARVLENPSVAVKSGETARIFSGTQVPFLVYEGSGSSSVEYKDVGITLEITPFSQGDDVDLEISVESSALGEIAPNGYQMIDTSSISTSEYCRAGESIVIGGLQRLSDRVEYNKVPDFEGSGTPLFTLYKSKDYKKSKSQFLVFITPLVHENSSDANRDLQDKFNLLEVRQ